MKNNKYITVSTLYNIISKQVYTDSYGLQYPLYGRIKLSHGKENKPCIGEFIFYSNDYAITENDRIVANKLCEKFKYLSYFILNRIDELLFDVYEVNIYHKNVKIKWEWI
jgi:hypothetical protein